MIPLDILKEERISRIIDCVNLIAGETDQLDFQLSGVLLELNAALKAGKGLHCTLSDHLHELFEVIANRLEHHGLLLNASAARDIAQEFKARNAI